MVKKEIIEKIAEKTGLNRHLVKRVVDEFLSVVSEAFKEKERVELRRFGVFYFKKRKRTIGRNLKTGEEIIIPEGEKLIFKPSFSKKHRGDEEWEN